MNVLVPRNLLSRQDQLSCVRAEQVVTLTDCPLHQLRPAVDEVVAIAEAIGAIRGSLVDGIGIVVQHQIRNRMMNDLPAFQVCRTNLHHFCPAWLSERDVRHGPVPHVLVLRRHRVLRGPDDEVGRPVAVPHAFPLVIGNQWLGCRHILRIALHRAAVNPADYGVHLFVGQ